MEIRKPLRERGFRSNSPQLRKPFTRVPGSFHTAVSLCGSFNSRYGGWLVPVAFDCYLAHINQFTHMVLEADNGEIVLSGKGRFVEESLRGEPQTKVVAGLRLYQWAAVASVVLGALFAAFDNGEVAPSPGFKWSTLLPAAVFGVVVFCAMGVDLPNSNRRFSRLT